MPSRSTKRTPARPAHCRLVPVLTASEILGVSRATGWRLIYDRALPSLMIRGRRMVDVQDIDAFIQQQKAG